MNYQLSYWLLSQNYKNANSDGMVGIGLGCFYGTTTKQIDVN